METSYTVEFYKIRNVGGINISDGVTHILGYDECYSTINFEEAKHEFEERKIEINAGNFLGVCLTIWENDDAVDDITFTSEDAYNQIIDKCQQSAEEFVDNILLENGFNRKDLNTANEYDLDKKINKLANSYVLNKNDEIRFVKEEIESFIKECYEAGDSID